MLFCCHVVVMAVMLLSWCCFVVMLLSWCHVVVLLSCCYAVMLSYSHAVVLLVMSLLSLAWNNVVILCCGFVVMLLFWLSCCCHNVILLLSCCHLVMCVCLTWLSSCWRSQSSLAFPLHFRLSLPLHLRFSGPCRRGRTWRRSPQRRATWRDTCLSEKNYNQSFNNLVKIVLFKSLVLKIKNQFLVLFYFIVALNQNYANLNYSFFSLPF